MENTTINTEAEDMPMNPIPKIDVNPYFYLNLYLVLFSCSLSQIILLGSFAIGTSLLSIDYYFNKQFDHEFKYMKIGTVLIMLLTLLKIIWLPEITSF